MKKLLTAALSLTMVVYAEAQGLINFDSQAIEQDFVYNLNLYGKRYTDPILGTFSFSQVNAWQHSAEVLNSGAFRVGFVTSAAFAPGDMLTFNFNEVGFSDKLSLRDPSDPTLVTALGGETEKVFEYTVNASNGASYTQEIPAFDGFSSPYNAIPNAVPQLSFGLPGGFEVQARVLPYLALDDVTHSEFGVGLKHQLDQYFKTAENLSFSVAASYDLNQFNYTPEDLLEGDNQNISLLSHAFLMEGMVSYTVGFVDLMAGLGAYYMNNNFQIEGTYRYEVERTTPLGQPVVQEAFSTTDPININREVSGLRLTTGLNLNLGTLVDLSIAYHAASVNSLSVGLSFAFLNGKK
jgi:hypothetical protein